MKSKEKTEHCLQQSRAFTFKSAIRASKSIRHTVDLKQKKLHSQTFSHAHSELPPLLVAVVGPPKVGKSTLIVGLVKQMAQQSISCVQGPITVISGKCSDFNLSNNTLRR